MDDNADTDLQNAVETFLSEADDAYEVYEKGYTDPDATLERLETAIERLRESAES